MGDDRSFIKIPSGKGVMVPFSIFTVLGSVLYAGKELYTWYENRVALEAKHKIEERDLVDRLERLERWRCRLGYDPGGVNGTTTLDRNRDCSSATLKKQREEQ